MRHMNMVGAFLMSVALMATGVTAVWAGTAATEVAAPDRADVQLLVAEGDSLLMRLQWTTAPRASFYRVEVGANDGEWVRNAATTTLTAAVWVPMTEAEQSAYACVVAWNVHPVRGEQEGGRRCTDFIVPADLAPPGQPGSIEIFPDTSSMSIAILSTGGTNLSLPSLGENAVEMSYAWRGTGTQYTCVRFPDGTEGLIESRAVDGWKQETVPNPRIWRLDDCHPEATVVSGSDLVTLHWAPQQPVLTFWPGVTPVVLVEDMIIFYAHRNSVFGSGLQEA